METENSKGSLQGYVGVSPDPVAQLFKRTKSSQP